MAPKRNFSPSRAHATLIAFIAVLSMVALMTTAVSAQCYCTGGHVVHDGAYCYPNWYSWRHWTLPVTRYKYAIYCQKRGSCIYGNCWWNKVKYGGSYCYVNDYFLRTGCRDRCLSRPICWW